MHWATNSLDPNPIANVWDTWWEDVLHLSTIQKIPFQNWKLVSWDLKFFENPTYLNSHRKCGKPASSLCKVPAKQHQPAVPFCFNRSASTKQKIVLWPFSSKPFLFIIKVIIIPDFRARNWGSLVVFCNYKFCFDDRDFKCCHIFDAWLFCLQVSLAPNSLLPISTPA